MSLIHRRPQEKSFCSDLILKGSQCVLSANQCQEAISIQIFLGLHNELIVKPFNFEILNPLPEYHIQFFIFKSTFLSQTLLRMSCLFLWFLHFVTIHPCLS